MKKDIEIKYPTMFAWGKILERIHQLEHIHQLGQEFAQNGNIALNECADADILSLIASLNKIDYSELQKERSMFESEIQGEANGV